MSPLITAGQFLSTLANWLQVIADYFTKTALVIVILLLLIRFLVERFNLNPFGRMIYYARRPTDRWFYEIKGSQFYQPIKRALGFEPVWILLLLAFVLLFFLVRSLVNDVVLLLSCLGITLGHFGAGDALAGVWASIGTVLLGLIFFLMGLMTILVINSWFGLFDRAAYWAGQRIYPARASGGERLLLKLEVSTASVPLAPYPLAVLIWRTAVLNDPLNSQQRRHHFGCSRPAPRLAQRCDGRVRRRDESATGCATG
jgi:hypothetical protein